MKEQKNFFVSMAFLGLMFFTCGFALGINSLLIPILKASLQVSSMEAYMLIGARLDINVPWLQPLVCLQ